MIAYLRGNLLFKSPALLYIDVNNVGYEVHISLHTYSALQSKPEALVYTHLQIKEDAHTIYGFAELAEKELFLQLISVSGIGAGTARIMLSSMKPNEVTRAIVQSDTKLLESIKGIGKKTAERVVLELKDKLAKTGLGENIENNATNGWNNANKDAINALLALGIVRNVAENAVKKATEQLPNGGIEDLIKRALQLI